MKTIHFLIFAMASTLLSVSVFADFNGQHNDKTCYAKTAGGVDISSPCSARGTSCNADFSCSIGTVVGQVGDTVKEQRLEVAEPSPVNDAPAATAAKSELVKMDRVSTKLREKGSGMATGKRITVDAPDASTAKDTMQMIDGGGDKNDIRVKIVGKKSPLSDPADSLSEKDSKTTACPEEMPDSCAEGDKACEDTKATCHRGHVTVLK